jgi:acetoacetyl-CoA reductase
MAWSTAAGAVSSTYPRSMARRVHSDKPTIQPRRSGCTDSPRQLALEVARKGVTVNTISPGYIGTKMVMAIPKEVLDTKILPQNPLGRLGRPEEIAGLIIYLCSDEAAFVTGANIAINGGQHMQ